MNTRKLFLTSLLAAAATLSVPAYADDVSGDVAVSGGNSTAYVMTDDTTFTFTNNPTLTGSISGAHTLTTSGNATLATGFGGTGDTRWTDGNLIVSAGTLQWGQGGTDAAAQGNLKALGENITVSAGANLKLWLWTESKVNTSTDDKVAITSKIILNGTDSSTATLSTEDGSYYLSGGIQIGDGTNAGNGTFTAQWAKGHVIESLSGAGTFTINETTVNDTGTAFFSIAGDGGFSGTVNFNYESGANSAGAELHLLTENALKNATVNLRSSVAGKTATLLLDAGTVNIKGLTGTTAGRVVAATAGNTLAIALDGNTDNTFAGNIGSASAAVGLSISGLGSQTFVGESYLSSLSVGNAADADGIYTIVAFSGATNVSETITVKNLSWLSIAESGSLDFNTMNIEAGGAATLAGTVKINSASDLITVASGGSLAVTQSTVVFDIASSLFTDGAATLTIASGDGSFSNWNQLKAKNFTVDGAIISGRSEVDSSTNGQVSITLGTAASIVWNGGNSGTWDTLETNKIWTNAALTTEDKSDAFYTRDNVTFNTAGSVAVTVADGGVIAGNLTVSQGNVVLSGGDVTVLGTATIASGASLSYNNAGTQSLGVSSTDGTFIKTGTGTLTLSKSDASQGLKTLTVSGGNVILGNNVLRNVDGLTVTVGSGAVLDINGKTKDYANTVYILGGGALVNNGESYSYGNTQAKNITLKANSEVGGRYDHGLLTSTYAKTTLALNGHTLTKTGTGAFWLSTTSITTTDSSASSAGTIRIEDGSVKINDRGSGKSDASKADFVLAGGTLDLNGYNLSVRSISGTNGTLALGAKTLTVGENSDGSDYALSAAITGSGKIIKSDTGTLTLSGNSDAGSNDNAKFTGTLEINAGTVKFGETSGVLGKTDTSGGTLAENTRYAAVVKSGGTLDINGKTKDGSNCYKIELAGGALLNNGDNVEAIHRQITGLKLSANSTIGGIGNFGLIAGNYAANTLELNGNTLTKTGDNTFYLVSTTVGAGTIDVRAGELALRNATIFGSTTVALFSMQEGALIKLDGGTIKAGIMNNAGNTSVALGNVAIVFSEKNKDTERIAAESGCTFNASGATLYLDIGALKETVLTGEQVALTIAAGNAIDSFFSDVQVGTYVDDAWVKDQQWAYVEGTWDNLTGTLSIAIPEPSMFGLLAGLGALALAGTRRRRRKA